MGPRQSAIRRARSGAEPRKIERRPAPRRGAGAGRVEFIGVYRGAAGRECDGEPEKPSPANHISQPTGGAFILPYRSAAITVVCPGFSIECLAADKPLVAYFASVAEAGDLAYMDERRRIRQVIRESTVDMQGERYPIFDIDAVRELLPVWKEWGSALLEVGGER